MIFHCFDYFDYFTSFDYYFFVIILMIFYCFDYFDYFTSFDYFDCFDYYFDHCNDDGDDDLSQLHRCERR